MNLKLRGRKRYGHIKRQEENFEQISNQKTDPQVQQPMVDISVEHVQELEDELLKLRIENAF